MLYIRSFMKVNAEKSFERVQLFKKYYSRLSRHSGFEQMAQYPQHGSTSRLLHSVAVAFYSYWAASFFCLPFHLEELVRGALLHDYFLYDAQDGDPSHKKHWVRHPEIALHNARREVELSAIEIDIIRTHMFPLTSQPPKYGEAAMVSLIDKLCSAYEFFKRKEPYRRLRCKVAGLSMDSLFSCRDF